MAATVLKNAFLVGVFAAALLMLSCAGPATVESPADAGAPAWVAEGTHALTVQNRRVFHGVGRVPRASDTAAQSVGADERARAELAGLFSTFMVQVSEAYAATGVGAGRADGQEMAAQVDALRRASLEGSRIVARWIDSRTSMAYSMAESDLRQVKERAEQPGFLSEGYREFFRAHADDLFDRFARRQ